MRYENEKAPAGVAALAEAWKDDFAVNHSVPNFITSVGKSLHIFELLQTGAENGVTLRELVALTGMNERLVRFKIQQERKAGKLTYFGFENPDRADADGNRAAEQSAFRRAADLRGRQDPLRRGYAAGASTCCGRAGNRRRLHAGSQGARRADGRCFCTGAVERRRIK